MSTGRAETTEEKQAILAMLLETWEMYPAQRFGQLIANWAYATLSNPDHGQLTRIREMLDHLFFIEDGDLAHGLLLWYTQQEPAQPGT